VDEPHCGYSRDERLRKRERFLEVYRLGEKFRGRYFFLYFLRNDLSYSRLGITVTRKLGKTVIRNRIKRRLREIYRKNKQVVLPPCDLVVNVTHSAVGASYQELERDFLGTVGQWVRKCGGCLR